MNRFQPPRTATLLFAVPLLACGRDSSVPQAASGTGDATAASRVALSPPAVTQALRDSEEWVIDGHPQFAGRVVIRGSRLMLALDTMGDGAPRPWIPVDSVSASVLPIETFSTACGRSATSRSGDTVAVVRDTAADSYRRPRLVWFLDVGANQIRSLVPDSIRCVRKVHGE
jgi:hypothetical protein